MKRPRLRELSERLGIISAYVDQTGRHVRRTGDATREALLSIMGFDTPSEDAARGWLDALEHDEHEAIVDPVRVVRRDDAAAQYVRVRLPPSMRAAGVEVTLAEESGHVWNVRADIRRSGTIRLPTRVPIGYHRITARAGAGLQERIAEQAFIVTPSSCVTPAALFRGRERTLGIVANLYSVRRDHDWGVGDLTSLTRLVEWAAARGAGFVGVNPLHALYNRGWDISPYSPVSRLFRNAIYIDVESVPEFARSPAARVLLNDPSVRAKLRALHSAMLVDYDGVIALKEQVLAELHRTFREHGGERAREYEAFVARREPDLTRFGTWMALAETSGVPDWRRWPEPLRDPASPAVAAFQEANAERVDFHRWLQFEAQRQLRAVADRARVLGMPIGVYQDLAIGTSQGGSDTWSHPELFLTGASVGAPPDPYAAEGQNWGLPPIDPRALRVQGGGYRYWIELLRRAFEHAGALRIDHVMGLFRAFWIPDGGTGRDGAYVRFPANDLLGILALESVRHNALVVGEDLGTVPPDVPPALRKWGVLSSRVLYFERERRGFRSAARYPSLALATANTHDMPTLAGFWTERDIALRRQVGLLRTAAAVRRAVAERRADTAALLALLKLAPPKWYEEAAFTRTLTAAVHDFLCSTKAVLVGQSLDDLAGEVDPVNVPGVGPDAYPSWRRRMRMTLEEIGWSFAVDDSMRCAGRRERP